jgi:hypothetical protein
MASSIGSLIQWTDELASKPWIKIENVFQKEVTDFCVRVSQIDVGSCPNYTRNFNQSDVDGLIADGFPAVLIEDIILPSIESAMASSCYEMNDITHAKIAARSAYNPKTLIVVGLTNDDVTSFVATIQDVRAELDRILAV